MSGLSITTRGGDEGRTALPGGVRVLKSAGVFEALGALDELSCALGVVRAALPAQGAGRNALLREIQVELIAISGVIAGYTKPGARQPGETALEKLDSWVKGAEERAPADILRDWAVPGDTGMLSAFTDQARTAARRAERSVVAFGAENPDAVRFFPWLNRLSDALWWMARLDPESD